MAVEMFFYHFKDLAAKETRTLHILPDNPSSIPAGEYALMEAYCTDPTCDCRRVLFKVFEKDRGEIATISFGFDPDGPMRGPFLDPMHKHAPYAQELMELINDLTLRDPAYLARLERHYLLVKEKTGGARPRQSKAEKDSGTRPSRPKPKNPGERAKHRKRRDG